MKFVAGIFLVHIVSFGQSVIVNCKFKTSFWEDPVGIAYTCQSIAENTGNFKFIEEVRGSHLSGKSNVDVLVFQESGNKLQFIPTNLVNFFPNLTVIWLNAPLLQLTASDLQPFPNLIRFDSFYGEFKSIDGDLFQSTKKLKVILVFVNKLENVGENLLSGLNELTFVRFMKTRA